MHDIATLFEIISYVLVIVGPPVLLSPLLAGDERVSGSRPADTRSGGVRRRAAAPEIETARCA